MKGAKKSQKQAAPKKSNNKQVQKEAAPKVTNRMNTNVGGLKTKVALMINGKAPARFYGGCVTLKGKTWQNQCNIGPAGEFKLCMTRPEDGMRLEIVLADVQPQHVPTTNTQTSTATTGTKGRQDQLRHVPTVEEQQSAAMAAAEGGRQAEFEQEMHQRVEDVTMGSCGTFMPGSRDQPGSALAWCSTALGYQPACWQWHFWVCHGCQTAQFWGSCVNGCSWQHHGWTCIDHTCHCPAGCETTRAGAQQYWREYGRDWMTRVRRGAVLT